MAKIDKRIDAKGEKSVASITLAVLPALAGVCLGGLLTFGTHTALQRQSLRANAETALFNERLRVLREYSDQWNERAMAVQMAHREWILQASQPAADYEALRTQTLAGLSAAVGNPSLRTPSPQILFIAEAVFGPKTKAAIHECLACGHSADTPDGHARSAAAEQRRLDWVAELQDGMESRVAKRVPIDAIRLFVMQMIDRQSQEISNLEAADRGRILSCMQSELWFGLTKPPGIQ
jgi:hypothetical protein